MVETGGLENVSLPVVLPVSSRLAPRIIGFDCDLRAHSARSMQPCMQPKTLDLESNTKMLAGKQASTARFIGSRL